MDASHSTRFTVLLVSIGVACGGPRSQWPPQMFSICSHFVLWESASQTKIL